MTEAVIQGYCKFPESSMKASRDELDDLKLKIEGNLPEDIQGHVFIVAPVGSVNSGGLPYPDGDSLLNGDGMIYRFDFDRQGEVRVKTRLVKPPDYYADKATQPGTKYGGYQFSNYGIARFSLSLGLRNQLNTDFLKMKFAQDSQERLLVTYDAGRPYEIDTDTLEVVTPVGSNQEWRGQLDKVNFPINAKKFPFKSILSTAHPAFDAYESKMFTVNYGKSAKTFIEDIAWINSLNKFYEKAEPFRFMKSVTELISDVFQKNEFRFLILLQNKLKKLVNLLENIIKIEMEDFTYLICWDGVGELKRWKLILPDGSPVKIEQTIHQIGVTKDYVVLMDTAFTAGLSQVTNSYFTENKELETLLRHLLERPACPDSKFYIVRRADLKAKQTPASSQKEVEVVVRQVVIPLQAAHFLVDYDNPQGEIILHVAHICAMQVSAWLRKYDVSAYKPHHPVPSYLHGMEHDEMDISRMGRYVINGDTGKLIESKVIWDFRCTWGVDLYSYLDRLPTGLPPGQMENIYWSSFGLWPQLMTKFIFDLHKDDKYQVIPRSKVLNLAKKGIPPCLFRLHTKSMVIADRYEFPCGHMMLSPQFVPRGNRDSSTNGYIVCAVCFEDKNEIWIFDANDLAKGSLCRLHHPDLKFGFTLHTTWLRQVASRQANYNIPVEQDYQDLVDKNDPEIKKLFEDEVYPHFS